MTKSEKLFAQTWNWEFTELKGQVLARIYGFTFSPSDDHPEKVVMELENGQTHSFFMSGGGCWRQLDEDDIILERENYEDARIVDYTQHFGLRGQAIQRVWCGDVMPITIQIELTGGLFTFTEGDWNAPDAIDTIRFQPDKALETL